MALLQAVPRLVVIIQATWASPTPGDRAAALAVMAELAAAATPEEIDEAKALAAPSATQPPPPPPPPTPAPTMAPTPNFAAFAENLLTAHDGDQEAAHTAFAALLGALNLENDTPTAPDEEPEPEEPNPEPEPEPTVPEPPVALAAVTATCTAITKRKKRCKNKVKKGSTNGLCALHQPTAADHPSDDDAAAGPAAGDPLPEPKAAGPTVDHCVCSFPNFFVADGIQSCSCCGKDDHYKGGVIADWSSSEDEADAEPTSGEAVEANAFFAEVATATPVAADDDTPAKVWNGFGTLPSGILTDDYGLFKLSWEAKGYKVTKPP